MKKINNCSPLSQKVINYLVKCFLHADAQNKGDSKAIQTFDSILPISQLFPMPLEITPTVKLGGVSLRAIQQPTSTRSCHIEKICMEKSYSEH